MISYDTKGILSWGRLGMRKAFGDVMNEIARENSSVTEISAGFSQLISRQF